MLVISEGVDVMEISNQLEVEIKKFGKTVAHTGCFFSNGTVQVKDLFVREKFRSKGLADVLLTKIQEYADQKRAEKIVAYCGPEPMCEDKSMPVEDQIAWYKSQGFIHDHDLYGVVPCMVKVL